MGGLGQCKTRGIPRHRFPPPGFNWGSVNLVPLTPRSPSVSPTQSLLQVRSCRPYPLARASDPTLRPKKTRLRHSPSCS